MSLQFYKILQPSFLVMTYIFGSITSSIGAKVTQASIRNNSSFGSEIANKCQHDMLVQFIRIALQERIRRKKCARVVGTRPFKNQSEFAMPDGVAMITSKSEGKDHAYTEGFYKECNFDVLMSSNIKSWFIVFIGCHSTIKTKF